MTNDLGQTTIDALKGHLLSADKKQTKKTILLIKQRMKTRNLSYRVIEEYIKLLPQLEARLKTFK